MAILEIPKGPDALSPEWLTAALQGSGAATARVASFEYEPIAAGVGGSARIKPSRSSFSQSRSGPQESSITARGVAASLRAAASIGGLADGSPVTTTRQARRSASTMPLARYR